MTKAILNTTEGKIEINLFDDKAPNTVKNFIGLATGAIAVSYTQLTLPTNREV